MSEETAGHAFAPGAILEIVIVAHPDRRRLGERAFCRDPQALNRLAPLFAPPGSGAGRALDEPSLSRDLLRVELGVGGAIEVHQSRSATRSVAVGGHRLREHTTLQPGTVLTLNRRVAVVLDVRSTVESAPAWLPLQSLRSDLQSSLWVGAPGVGKTHWAKWYHAQTRAEGPIVCVDARTLQSAEAVELLVGRHRVRTGLLQEAHEGSLVITSFAELSTPAFELLRRCLEHQSFRPVGGDQQQLRCHIAAICRQRVPLATQSCFDVVIDVPALKARPAEVAVMARDFLDEELRLRRAPQRGDSHWVHPEVWTSLLEQPLDGNVRELRALMRQAAHVDRPRLRPEDCQLRSHRLGRRSFEKAVRHALKNFHRADRLQQSPLLGAAILRGEAKPVGRLRDMLLEVTEGLGVASGDALHTQVVQRAFLEARRKQIAVALEMGMGYSTFRKHLRQATERVVDELWQREQALVRGAKA